MQSSALKIENPADGPKPVGPYSQVAKIDLGTSYLLMVSGQIGVDANGQLVSDSMAEQTAQAFSNLESLLKCYGANLDAVANIRTYLADMSKIREYGRVRLMRFGDHVPTSTTIEASHLFMPGALLEIEVTAVIPK